jgi:hypothetical protein
MVYRGVVRGNAIVLEAGMQLPEGTEVEVILREEASGGIPKEEQDERKTLGVRYGFSLRAPGFQAPASGRGSYRG